MSTISRPEEFSDLTLHQGNLLYLAAKQYKTIHLTMLEIVQNAIDSNAAHITVVLDQQRRRINVYDNGEGASIEKFNQALESVGDSIKTRDKLGRFGLGLVSPLGKCERFTFTSCPREAIDGDAYVQWEFVSKELKKKSANIRIPRQALSNYRRGPENRVLKYPDRDTVQQVDWSTRVTVHNYATDRTIGRIESVDDFATEVFRRFGIPMRRRGVRLSLDYTDVEGNRERKVNLEAPAFEGKPLKREVVHHPVAADRTFFELYLAPNIRGQQTGEVFVRMVDDEFRLPFADFVNDAMVRECLSSDVIAALQSGLFSGEIISTMARLDEDRLHFSHNDALAYLCETINIWYQDHGGADHFHSIKEGRRNARHQRLALQVVENLKKILRRPENTDLAESLDSFKLGSIGPGHTPPDPTKVRGKQKEKTRTSNSDPAEKLGSDEAPVSPRESKPKPPPKRPLPNHHPMAVAGPQGKKRTVVEDDSLGLRLCHIPMEGRDELYEFDATDGTVYFNIRHPTWVLCDQDDQTIMQLQEAVVIIVLRSTYLPDEWKEVVRDEFASVIDSLAVAFVLSSSFKTGRRRKT